MKSIKDKAYVLLDSDRRLIATSDSFAAMERRWKPGDSLLMWYKPGNFGSRLVLLR